MVPPRGWKPKAAQSAAAIAGGDRPAGENLPVEPAGPVEPAQPAELAGAAPPPLKSGPPPIPTGAVVATLADLTPTVPLDPELETVPETGSWLGQLLSHQGVLWGAIPAVGLATVVGVCSIFLLPRGKETPDEPAAETEVAGAAAVEPVSTQPKPQAVPSRLDRRWLPDRTRLVFQVRVSALGSREEFGRVTQFIDPAWRPSVERVMGAFGCRRGPSAA